ncbi:unnamed protein product [Caenorhabditis auriculariae]|uniref:HTH psq-type domain-containing protein n=1 Tax=Caenorhabditis auriculariae TaxID=2777116 RepID=A0A8S1GZ26_9PELO|nr:unnamed protein product [Caenorhabditis auriculariae]
MPLENRTSNGFTTPPKPGRLPSGHLQNVGSLYQKSPIPNTPQEQAMLIRQYQLNVEIMNQMQLLGLLPQQPTIPQLPLSSEMQRLILENQMPYPPPFFQNPWTSMIMNMQKAQQQQQQQLARDQMLAQKQVEIPLDLSKKPDEITPKKEIFVQETEKNERNLTPEEFLAKSLVAKRNYSAEDLASAVEDIRCGKLGTRRASVVYGIPRSTLRNKIYKLEASEETSGASPPKRRRAGGQSVAEKKMADEIEKQHKRSASQCSETNGSESPGSPDSDSSGHSVESLLSVTKFEDFPKPVEPPVFTPSPEWAAALWQSLFKSQRTQMTADVMNVSQARCSEDKNAQEDSYSMEEWKKSRPKRGQYRKYDKNALDEAVQSVRRGEMSVHRAGSFYGVPHSTLEYKVKERNLMRKKKGSLTPSSSMDEGNANDDSRSEPSPTSDHHFNVSIPLQNISPTSIV